MKAAHGAALAVLLASLSGAAAYGYNYGYGGVAGGYGLYGYTGDACSIHLNFTSHSDTSYKCGDNTCKVIQVAVTNYLPWDIPYGWGMTLTSPAWSGGEWGIYAWWNCNNVKLAKGTLSLTSNAEWQHLAPGGGTESFGFILSGPSDLDSAFTPHKAILTSNGVARSCAII